MTQKGRIVVIVGILVLVIILEGRVCATSTVNLRRIVSFRPITSTGLLCKSLPLLPNGYCLDLTTPLGYETALAEVQAVPGVEVVEIENPTVHKLWISNALLIQLPANNITGALSSLLQSLYVVNVTRDIIAWVDPIIPFPGPLGPEHYDWGLERIYIPEVRLWWPALKGSEVTVAILDTGIALGHSDLNIGTGTNAIEEELNDPPDDYHGHGTHMAGIIGAKVNGVGTKGAAPEATVVPVKVLDSTGFGRLSEFLRGLQWLHDTNIRLASMSIQFRADYPPLKMAIQRLSEKGVIMVAAAGNRCALGPPDEGGGDDGGTCDPSQYDVAYPAAYPGVIAVGATEVGLAPYYNRITAYSRSGSTLDMVAPGGSQATGIRILSTYLDDGYGYGSGTSQATAHITGICALVLQLKPDFSFDAVLNSLKTHSLDDPSTNEPYPSDMQGDGLADAEETVEALCQKSQSSACSRDGLADAEETVTALP